MVILNCSSELTDSTVIPSLFLKNGQSDPLDTTRTHLAHSDAVKSHPLLAGFATHYEVIPLKLIACLASNPPN